MKIRNIQAIEILDSRGFPTLEVFIELEDHSRGFGISPSGASTGSSEAFELRDNDKDRYCGKGVKKALANVNNIIKKAILNKNFATQEEFDLFLINLDGTENKSNLGANAILSTSFAFSDAFAKSKKISYTDYIEDCFKKYNAEILKKPRKMPIPLVNILNGGKHADNNLNIQEFMIIPICYDDFQKSIEIGAGVFHSLKKILKNSNLNTNVGDEGGFAPNLKSTEEALNLINESILKAGYVVGRDVFLALDVAASEFYNSETKKYKIESDLKELNIYEMVDFYENLVKKYNIFSIEDPFHEKDYFGFELLYKKIGWKAQIVGDDLFTTNKKIISKLSTPQIANSVLIKPNQIGTLSETLETIAFTQLSNYEPIMSHRSGETEDVKIAHVAIGTRIKQVKFGSFSRTDRTGKYNELLRISNYNDIRDTAANLLNFNSICIK